MLKYGVIRYNKLKEYVIMCDTVGRIINDSLAIFAKNSDRSANEPQVIEFVEHRFHDEKTLKCTYVTIEQVKETNAMVISRPIWLWGAEMGVNEHGVCIGNEAVFTKGKYGSESLIGMDYLRLALERGNTAYESLKVITDLLEKYGQGGNCGYDKDFRYDNSYLIMDRKEVYVLETAGKNWAYKKYDHVSISNRLMLGDDCDRYSGNRVDFRKQYSDLLFSTFSQAASRRKCTMSHKLENVYDAFSILRQHDVSNPMSRGTVSSVCMHSGDLFADQTTSSMVVQLKGQDIRIYVTGSSRPCLSVFKAYGFGKDGIIFAENRMNETDYWYEMEDWQRSLLGKKIPAEYYRQRDQIEKQIIENADADGLEQENRFYRKWKNYRYEDDSCAVGFRSFWKKKNKALEDIKKGG